MNGDGLGSDYCFCGFSCADFESWCEAFRSQSPGVRQVGHRSFPEPPLLIANDETLSLILHLSSSRVRNGLHFGFGYAGLGVRAQLPVFSPSFFSSSPAGFSSFSPS